MPAWRLRAARRGRGVRAFSKTSTGVLVESDMPGYSHRVGSAAVPGSVEVRPVAGPPRAEAGSSSCPSGSTGAPPWVPPLIFERRQFLDREKNPYFEHAEAEYFLAWRDGEPVGRITAQVDRRWDEFQGGSDGQFGFFEAEDDPEVFEALLGDGRGLGRANAGASACSARWTSRPTTSAGC